MRSRRKVEELLRKRLGEVFDDVGLADDAREVAASVHDREVAVAARLHQGDRVTDRLFEVEVLRVSRHEGFDRLVEVDLPGDDAAEDVTLCEGADERPAPVPDETEIAGTRA